MPAPESLTTAEAALRLARVGRNVMPRPPRRTAAVIVRDTLREPMFALLLAAAGLYLALGDVEEGAFLMLGALAAIGLVVAQEARSEQALEALRSLAEPRARVRRDDATSLIPSGDLVPGDLLVLGEGERIAADAALVAGDVLSVDEAILTGESAPVVKRPAGEPDEAAAAAASPGAPDQAFVFAGTLVTRGQGLARVTRTGPASALGRIGGALAAAAPEPTPLQRSASRLVGLLGVFAILFCVLIALVYGGVRQDWVGGALAGVTAAIALIPEEFPMVLAVFTALGAWRLAARRVLVRRGAAIEALGAVTLLCVDKTGTLTRNHMRVARAEPAVGAAAGDLAGAAVRASAVAPADPMDRAVLEAFAERRPAGWPLRSWPLTPERLAFVQLWPGEDGGWRIAAKGAPEAIARLCGDALAPPQAAAMAEQGLRVLGVAEAHGAGAPPETPEAVRFAFMGLLGFEDPLREDVPPALREAAAAGIAVAMITGDHPATALAVAAAAGVDLTGGAITGAELDALDDAALRDRLGACRVFARITPEQKLRLVQAFRARGAVVAMTGDGVNDAPALEAAHIGIAMGGRGSDVAREAADLVLLDDSFASIVGGVRLGRRIFANLRKALTYITAIHVPIAGLALLPLALGAPPLLLPMHVVLLELAIDPTCALAFEAERSEPGAMRRPPRDAKEPLFGRRELVRSLIQGASVLFAVLAIYLAALPALGEAAARGAGFLALVAGNASLALADAIGGGGRILDPHRRIAWLIVGALALALLLIFVSPAGNAVFRMGPPPAGWLQGALLAGVAAGTWLWLLERAARAAGLARG